MNAKTQNTSKQAWLECAKWLDLFGVFNTQISNRLRASQFTISDLVYALRDGVVLCKLLNVISPGSIDTSQISTRTLSRLACTRNIKMFLEASKKLFELKDEQLFQAGMLYDLELECVISALSAISKLKQVEQACGRSGFDMSSNQADLDIYDKIESVEETDDAVYGLYLPPDAILEPQDTVYKALIEEETVYENEQPKSIEKPMKLEKRDHNMREIYQAEGRYVDTLKTIVNDYMQPLSAILSDEDRRIIFLNIESIEQLHVRLLKNLNDAISGGKGRTSRICQVFDELKREMMTLYVDCINGLDGSREKISSLAASSPTFKTKMNECNRKSKMKGFQLCDIICIPSQRILKYHVTFTDLDKHTEAKHEAKAKVKETTFNLKYLGDYLNEAKRDQESLDNIETLIKHCTGFDSSALYDFGHSKKDDNVRIKEHGRLMSKTRTLFLFEKAILVFKSKGDDYYYEDRFAFNEYKLDETQNMTQLTLTKHRESPAQTITLCFRNTQQRNDWKKLILEAISSFMPPDQNKNNHRFELTNFSREIFCCNFCKKELLGIFYQGYKCLKCSSIAHKGCMSKIEACRGASVASISPKLPLADLTKAKNEFIPYQVRALYNYQGKPIPPDGLTALKLSVGEIVQVTDDDDNDWWKGRKGATGEEGYFPNRLVKIQKQHESYVHRSTVNTDSGTQAQLTLEGEKSIKKQPWFEDCSRDTANNILNRITNPADITLFMVRKGQDGGFAVSIKTKSKIEHIRIYSSRSDGKFYLVAEQQFETIPELINFYRKFNLKNHFEELDTELGMPFREYQALPKVISDAVALYDYTASGPEEISLKKESRYWVTHKESNGWWRVYNNSGQIGYAPGNYLR